MPKVKRSKYYAIYSKNDKFLHGVFPLSKDGLKSAKAYLIKISPKNRNNFYIEKK
jgi:hypothetical protein